MVRYFLTDLRGNPIYSFAQRFRHRSNPGANNHTGGTAMNHAQLLLLQQQQQQQQQQLYRDSLVVENNDDDYDDRENNATQYHHGNMNNGDKKAAVDGDTYINYQIHPKAKQQQQQQFVPVTNFHSIPVICMIRNQMWEDVMKRIESLHNEIYTIDSISGNTLLHVTFRYNPPSNVIECIAQYIPILLRYANHDGIAPLHIAVTHRCSKDTLLCYFDCCRRYHSQKGINIASNHRSDQDVSFFNQQNENYGNNNNNNNSSPTTDCSYKLGRTPMHYACMSWRGLDLDAFQLLVNETLLYGNISIDITPPSRNATNRYSNVDDWDDQYSMNGLNFGNLKGSNHNMEVLDENHVLVPYTNDYECRDDNNNNDDNNNLCLFEFDQDVDQDLYQLYTGTNSAADNDEMEVESILTKQTYQQQKLSQFDEQIEKPSFYNNDANVMTTVVNVMGIKDATGQTPLGLLFKRYRERVKCVINTVDKIRYRNGAVTSATHPSTAGGHQNDMNDVTNRAALVAAIQVHTDLGELWDKARWIISRLTEERILREQQQASLLVEKKMLDGKNIVGDAAISSAMNGTQIPLYGPQRRIGTSNNDDDENEETDVAVSYSNNPQIIYEINNYYTSEPPSPIAQEAASWALELHPSNYNQFSDSKTKQDQQPISLPFAPDISTRAMLVHDRRPTIPPHIKGTTSNTFRIVHASVGLTGYGCPPELIRLAISIHPNQVMEMDSDGNLPIHIAVTAASYLAYANPMANTSSSTTGALSFHNHSSNNSVGGGGGGGDDHSSVISDAALSFFSTATVSQTTNPFDQVIKMLLQHYPDSARVPQGKTGKLPLILAIQQQEESKIDGTCVGRRTWKDGIRTLLHAYPPALHNKKVIEPILYPHVLALVANNGQQQQDDVYNNNGSSTDDGNINNNNKYAQFDFSGYVDVLPNTHKPTSTRARSYRQYNNMPSISHFNNCTTAGSKNKQFPYNNNTKSMTNSSNKKSQRTIRHELNYRTTLFELLRSKPEWLTLGYIPTTTTTSTTTMNGQKIESSDVHC